MRAHLGRKFKKGLRLGFKAMKPALRMGGKALLGAAQTGLLGGPEVAMAANAAAIGISSMPHKKRPREDAAAKDITNLYQAATARPRQ
ncbi:MAG: hypothetical protein V4671_28445 [Armatimonadota bacterium]